jgi:hypothetical protein
VSTPSSRLLRRRLDEAYASNHLSYNDGDVAALIGRPDVSPSVVLARRGTRASLGARVGGVGEHVAADHLAEEAPRMRLTHDLLRSVDAVVPLTDHDDIDYGLVKCEARRILDCRDRMSGANAESL